MKNKIFKTVVLTEEEYIIVNQLLKTVYDALDKLPNKMKTDRFYTISNLYNDKFCYIILDSGDLL